MPQQGKSTRDDAGDGRLWSKPFSLAIAVNFFISLVFYLLMTSMALYAVDRFGASDTAAGLTAGSFVLGALTARVFAGKFLDFVGRRRMLLAGLLFYTVAALFYTPAGSLEILIAIRVIHGAAFGLASTALSASVMALIPAGRRGEGTGYFSISNTLATAVGPFLAVLLVDRPATACFTWSRQRVPQHPCWLPWRCGFPNARSVRLKSQRNGVCARLTSWNPVRQPSHR